MQDKAIKARENLSYAEKVQRDSSFKQSCAYSTEEGWLWDICWAAAKEYYEDKL